MSLLLRDTDSEFEDHFRSAYTYNSSFRAVVEGLRQHREQLKEECVACQLPEAVRFELIGRARLIQEILDLTKPLA